MEDIGRTLSHGFRVWQKNLFLCIPFILNSLAATLIVAPSLAAIAILVLPTESMSALNETMLQNESAMEVAIHQITKSIEGLGPYGMLEVAGLFLLMMLLLILSDSFFTAGAIGMSVQALESGRSDTGTMWSSGRRHFFRLFLLNLLVGLLIIPGMIFLLPSLSSDLSTMGEDPEALGLFGFGLIIFILYSLALSVVMAVAPFALVIEELGAIQAVRASVDFFRYNKFDVVVLWLVVVALAMGFQMASGALSAGDGAGAGSEAGSGFFSLVLSLIEMLVLYPLANLWWTRLYMSRRGRLPIEEVNDPW